MGERAWFCVVWCEWLLMVQLVVVMVSAQLLVVQLVVVRCLVAGGATCDGECEIVTQW